MASASTYIELNSTTLWDKAMLRSCGPLSDGEMSGKRSRMARCQERRRDATTPQVPRDLPAAADQAGDRQGAVKQAAKGAKLERQCDELYGGQVGGAS